MPAIGDYLGAACQRVFDLCAAEPLWVAKIKPAARLARFGGQGQWPTINPVRKDPLIVWDFRILRGVPMPGRPNGGLPVTFGVAGGVAGAPLVIEKQYTLQHQLIHPSLIQTDATYLETLLELILLRAGRKLTLNGNSLAYANGALPVTSAYVESGRPEFSPNGSPRLVQTLTHPVGVVAKSADILGI